MTLFSLAVLTCRFGDRVDWLDCVEAFDRFRASLCNLGLAKCALIGPLMEPRTAPLMLPAASTGGAIPEFAPPESARLTGDQDRLFAFACSFCWSVAFGFCITERRNLLAFSRETATLKDRHRFDRERKRETRSSGLVVCTSSINLIQMRPGPVRRGRNSLRGLWSESERPGV